jgi:hypothetical protein
LKTLIVSSCTGKKAVDHPKSLTLEDFQSGPGHVARRERQLAGYCRTAGEIYTGEQHVRLMRGVQAMRRSGGGKAKNDIHVRILSAGYGVIPESRVVAPYEVTFATMKTKELRAWADAINVPEDFRKTVLRKYDLGLILLGDNYLQACALDETVKFGGPTLLFCGTAMANKLPALKNVRVVPISNPEAKRFFCGLVGLKGELAARVLAKVRRRPDSVFPMFKPGFDLLGFLQSPCSVIDSKSSSDSRPQ